MLLKEKVSLSSYWKRRIYKKTKLFTVYVRIVLKEIKRMRYES